MKNVVRNNNIWGIDKHRDFFTVYWWSVKVVAFLFGQGCLPFADGKALHLFSSHSAVQSTLHLDITLNHWDESLWSGPKWSHSAQYSCSNTRDCSAQFNCKIGKIDNTQFWFPVIQILWQAETDVLHQLTPKTYSEWILWKPTAYLTSQSRSSLPLHHTILNSYWYSDQQQFLSIPIPKLQSYITVSCCSIYQWLYAWSATKYMGIYLPVETRDIDLCYCSLTEQHR